MGGRLGGASLLKVIGTQRATREPTTDVGRNVQIPSLLGTSRGSVIQPWPAHFAISETLSQERAAADVRLLGQPFIGVDAAEQL